jgi:hypothetical protein
LVVAFPGSSGLGQKFFFEKKNQKTFAGFEGYGTPGWYEAHSEPADIAPAVTPAHPMHKVFLLLFLQKKKNLPTFPAAPSPPAY